MADVTDLLCALGTTKGCFHFSTLARRLKWNVARVRRTMDVFRRQNYVIALKPNCYAATDAGRAAMKEALKAVRKAEEKKAGRRGKAERESFSARVWKAIRTLRKFEIADLVQLAARPDDDTQRRYLTARTYVGALHHAGYLRMTRQRCVGGPRNRARYLLVPDMDTGPRPPAMREDGSVRDRNLDQVVLGPRGSVNRKVTGAAA